MKKLMVFPLILLLALTACAPANSAPRDGQYTVEVTLSGGSGRASVATPTEITVADGAMTARIIWSSPNYTFMLVDGTKYLPVNKSGNSTFDVPISALDTDIAISAETIAMSEPHVIDYTLCFDSATLKAAGESGTMTIIVVIAAAVAVAVGVLTFVVKKQKNKRKT